MKILALEFSSPVRGVAVSDGVKTLVYAEEPGGRETKPFALIDTALAKARLTRDDIECLAVGLGPGSHAGIRTAIAIAQGWQLARGVKLLGISSAEVVAAHAGQFGDYNVWVGLEAQRGEVFAARYDASVFKRPKLIEPFRRLNEAEAKSLHLHRMDWPWEPDRDDGIPFPPEAEFLAMLAAARTEFVNGSTLEPVYLRPVEFVKAPPSKFHAG